MIKDLNYKNQNYPFMKTLAIFKNNYKDNENQPDFKIMAKNGDELKEVGAAWKKQDKNGNTFLSGKLQEQYGEKPGFEIVEEEVTQVPTAQVETPNPEGSSPTAGDLDW